MSSLESLQELLCNKCGLYDKYICPHCGRCYQCFHKFMERLDGWYIRCSTGKWFKCIGPGK